MFKALTAPMSLALSGNKPPITPISKIIYVSTNQKNKKIWKTLTNTINKRNKKNSEQNTKAMHIVRMSHSHSSFFSKISQRHQLQFSKQWMNMHEQHETTQQRRTTNAFALNHITSPDVASPTTATTLDTKVSASAIDNAQCWKKNEKKPLQSKDCNNQKHIKSEKVTFFLQQPLQTFCF